MIRARDIGLWVLEILSVLELISIAVLLINVWTVHLRPITAIMGPAHGVLYIAVIVVALAVPGLLRRTRWMALIPVAGGVLCLINVRAERRRVRGGAAARSAR